MSDSGTTTTDTSGTPEDPTGERRVNPLRVGLAIMLVGAAVTGFGLIGTTSAHTQPGCPKGTTLVAKFEFKGGRYVFEKPAGNELVVTITNGNAKGGAWSSTVPIAAVVVKGGPGSATAVYQPPATAGTFSNQKLPPVGRGKTPDISNLQFCGPKTTTTTTTTEPTTSTTEATTSTTEATTSTTEATTSTTEATTSTTEATTSTTEATTSTTEATTSTTRPGAGSSTVPGSVAGNTASRTVVTPDDARANRADGALAFTGGNPLPVLVVGLALLLAGATMAAVAWQRQRHAEA